jgi:hypothetical protein
MLRLYEEAQAVFVPARLLMMIGEHGGLWTAQRLLDAPHVAEGFVKLWEAGRLDLAVEAVVLEEEWASLFTPDQLTTARRRLEDEGYNCL